jgi:CDP-diacylglycerol--glycerol-3-phosphate 3-phosphatidyltransferase
MEHTANPATIDARSGPKKRETASSGSIFGLLLSKRYHRSPSEVKDRCVTGANIATCLRAVIVSGLVIAACVDRSRSLLLIALLVNWGGDMLDGYVARRTERETVLGAQLDYSVDRLVATGVIVTAVALDHESVAVIVGSVVVWFQYGVLDHLLCPQFLRFDLWSPDEYWVRNELAWRVNWSPIAKLVGHLPLLLLALGVVGVIPSITIAAALMCVRGFVYLRNMEGPADIVAEAANWPTADTGLTQYHLDDSGASTVTQATPRASHA